MDKNRKNNTMLRKLLLWTTHTHKRLWILENFWWNRKKTNIKCFLCLKVVIFKYFNFENRK